MIGGLALNARKAHQCVQTTVVWCVDQRSKNLNGDMKEPDPAARRGPGAALALGVNNYYAPCA